MSEPIPQSDTLERPNPSTELTRWLEQNPMGSIGSKAFCDLVDLYERQAKIGLVGFSEDEPTLKEDIRTIRETIRQRTNELSGYMATNSYVHGIIDTMESEVKDKNEAYYTDQGVDYDPKAKVSEQLSLIKLNHINPPLNQE